MIVLNLSYKMKFKSEEDLYEFANTLQDGAQEDLIVALTEGKRVARIFIDETKQTERVMSTLESVK